MDNWLSKQHGHCWILMVLPKCHLTDVTEAPILKSLVSKTSIWAHSSPTVSGRDSTVCQASISEKQILHSQPYLHRTVHPLPEVHWTFPIIGIYHSPFKVEIKSVGMVRGEKNRHNWDLIGFIVCLLQNPEKLHCLLQISPSITIKNPSFSWECFYTNSKNFYRKIVWKRLRH